MKWHLSGYWKKNITDWLNENESDVIVDLLSGAYRKMIDWKKIQAKIITINFLKTNGCANLRYAY